MRWFKHLTDASDDDFIHSVEADFGLHGYARWWKLCEAIGKKLKKTDTRAAVALPWSVWQTILQGKPKLLRTFLERLQNEGRIKLKETGNILEIELPKLLKFRDEYSRKSGHDTDETPDKVPAQNTEDRVQKQSSSTSPSEKSRPSSPGSPRTRRPSSYAADSPEIKAARYLHEKIRENNPQAKIPNWQSWARDFDAIFRIDKRKRSEVRELIDLSQKHEFWRKNILSPAALRRQYDRLLLEQSHGPPSRLATREIATASLTDD